MKIGYFDKSYRFVGTDGDSRACRNGTILGQNGTKSEKVGFITKFGSLLCQVAHGNTRTFSFYQQNGFNGI